MKWVKRYAPGVLLVLMVLNVAATAGYFVLKSQASRTRPQPTLVEGAILPQLSGIDVHDAVWSASSAPCRVIRVTDDQCAFCKKDKASYERLVEAARSASCEIVEFAPQAGGMKPDPRPGVVQLKFISQDVGAALFPFVTPQTLILDSEWAVAMTRRGAFTEEALGKSIALLETIAGSRLGERNGRMERPE